MNTVTKGSEAALHVAEERSEAPLSVAWDIAEAAPSLLRELCRVDPWAEERYRALKADVPIPPTNNMFDVKDMFRPAGHFRAFYLRGPGSAVIAIKGREIQCADQEVFLKLFQQRPFERFAKYSIMNALEYFLIQERKIPGALTLPEALAEAGSARDVQTAFIERYGELGPLPVPLFVLRFSRGVVEKWKTRLLPLLTGFSLAIAEGELERGLGCYVYYFPQQPFPRVSHFAGELSMESARTGTSHFQNTRLIYTTLKDTDPEKVVESWIRLVARMLVAGYFPSNAQHFKNGQCIEPQNVLLNGAFADMDSVLPMSSTSSDREFYMNFLCVLNLLANTIRVFLTAEANGATVATSPFPHQFQNPDFFEILTVIHLWERLTVHLREQIDAARGGGVDGRLRELASSNMAFKFLFEKIFYSIYYAGPELPESLLRMLSITNVYNDVGYQEERSPPGIVGEKS
jgi:hypothetical protein